MLVLAIIYLIAGARTLTHTHTLFMGDDGNQSNKSNETNRNETILSERFLMKIIDYFYMITTKTFIHTNFNEILI